MQAPRRAKRGSRTSARRRRPKQEAMNKCKNSRKETERQGKQPLASQSGGGGLSASARVGEAQRFSAALQRGAGEGTSRTRRVWCVSRSVCECAPRGFAVCACVCLNEYLQFVRERSQRPAQNGPNTPSLSSTGKSAYKETQEQRRRISTRGRAIRPETQEKRSDGPGQRRRSHGKVNHSAAEGDLALEARRGDAEPPVAPGGRPSERRRVRGRGREAPVLRAKGQRRRVVPPTI